jgi:hypothetical protein
MLITTECKSTMLWTISVSVCDHGLNYFSSRCAVSSDGSDPYNKIAFLNLTDPSSRIGVDSASNRNEYQESCWG